MAVPGAVRDHYVKQMGDRSSIGIAASWARAASTISC